MTKLKVQFTLFFCLLSILVGTLLWHSYRQIDQEELRLWQGIGENTFNQMQANISGFMLKEDARSFSEYRYYYIPESQLEYQIALNVSPLSKLPKNNSHGIIGYFQINPDGSFSTPYLPPKKDWQKLTDLETRKNLESELSQLTNSLKNDIKTKEETSRSYVSATPTQKTKIVASRKKLYPNPLESKFADKAKSKITKAVSPESRSGGILGRSQGTDADESEALAQEVSSNIAQFQTFKEQKVGVLDQTPTPSIFTDPFRARLVGSEHLIFYRRIWLEKKMYLQGFVIDIKSFFGWLMQVSFENSRLPEFASAALNWDQNTLATYGLSFSQNKNTPLLFQRSLGYPLNQFLFNIYYNKLPTLSTRILLNTLAVLIFLIATGGLYGIYRSTAAEILLSQKRQDFVSAITHELKTPLTSIRLYSEMLNEGWADGEGKKQEYYGLISRESDRLSRLIENVLQLSRLEKKHYRFELATKNPRDDFNEMAKELETLVNKSHFEWKVTQSDTVPKITYDVDALKQILFTLVDNSLKFSKVTGKNIVEMKLAVEGSHVIWSVSDYGPGVPTNDLKRIFNKFHRTENEMTRKTKGTGIGLAMAKMLIEGMGAKIEAVNRKEGGLEIRLVFTTQSKLS